MILSVAALRPTTTNRTSAGGVDDIRLSAKVSRRSHDAIVEFTRWYGFSVSAFVEALGRELPDYEPPRRLPPGLGRVVKQAREISEERRRRPK